MSEESLHNLLVQYAKKPSDELLEQLVEGYMHIPRQIAQKFTGHGVEYDDLFQVACIALMKAIKRFDPSMEYKFITYATPTIVGDLRNFIRDKSNLIKASRSTKNLLYNINKVKDEFTQQHFRQPSVDEIASLLNVEKADIINAFLAQNSTNIGSLDATPDDESSDALSAFIGYQEEGYVQLENESFMHWVKENTSDQEYALIQCRFMQNLSQRETAKILKVSQMQVSRLEKRIFARLKEKYTNQI